MKVIGFCLLLFIAGAFAQDCSARNSCSTCTADANCGWCGPVGTCFNGTRQGPSAPQTCYGDSWFFQSTNPCPNCTALTDCKSCLYMDQDCAWCSSDNSCVEWGSKLGCGPVDTCPCNVYGTCSDCLNDVSCNWCNDTCVELSISVCPITHTCPCSSNNDCDSCFADANQGCVWCDEGGAGGYCGKGQPAGCMIAHNCNTFCTVHGVDCDSCNTLPGCGWCPDTLSCVDASVSTCLLQHTCPNCGIHRYCDPCQDAGCIWCSNGECRTPTDLNNCFIQHTCESYCQGYSDCSSCNDVSGCGWCEETQFCVDVDKSSCLIAHTCTGSSSKCGFDGGAFVGGMFLGVGLVAIAIGGYLFYRWKVGGGRANYRELH